MSNLIRHKDTLKKLNILLELILIIGMYWIAVFFRINLPIGSEYFRPDSTTYMILGIMFSITNVGVSYSFGGYFSFHIRGKLHELTKVLSTTIIGFCVTCTFIYLMKWEQFSRVLLIYFVVLSFISIYVKRVVVDKLVRAYDEKYRNNNDVLLVGSGLQAEVVYKTLLATKYMNLNMVGYVADKENGKLPGFLGSKEELREILLRQESQLKVDMILIADPEISYEEIQQIVVLATNHNTRVGIVPSFAEFLPSKNAINMYKGNYICELTALDSCDIMGVKISVTNMEKTVARIKKHLGEWSGKYICISNVHTTVTASEDASYKKIHNGAVVALPDGGPLSKYSRDKGYSDAERVTGPDLMKRILQESAENGWKHLFYGSTQETLDKLKKVIEERYPGAEIVGMISPPFRPLTIAEDEEIVEEIKRTNPDFVWVGLGAPKQEVWMAAHQDKIPGLMIGVGAAFDYEAGNIKRAPKWMQKANLEWLYRLTQDPKRLFTRYFHTNTKYLLWKYRHGGKNE